MEKAALFFCEAAVLTFKKKKYTDPSPIAVAAFQDRPPKGKIHKVEARYTI